MTQQVVILAHALPSMVPVIRRVVEAGIGVTFIGKPYSTIRSAAEAMRDCGATVHCPGFGRVGHLVQEMRAFVQALSIPPTARLFDSGGILRSLHGRGNQLTTHGSRRPDDIGLNPKKRQAEAPHIARAVLSQIDHAGRRVMVIGDGVIGSAIKTQLATSVESDPGIIIGATGCDISRQVQPLCGRGAVQLFSASSWDIEFNALLKNRPPSVSIGNYGCPMNFTRHTELEPEHGMAETRAILLSAILSGA